MSRPRQLVIGSILAALTLTAVAAPASAADPNGTLADVNGIPGKKVDVCLNNREIKSALRYGQAVLRGVVATGDKNLKFFARDARTCRGTVLAKTSFPLAAGSDVTVVVTKNAPKIVSFDNTGLREIIDLVTAIPVHAQEEGTILSTGAPSAPWIAYQAILDGAVNIGLVHADGSDDHAIPGGPGNRWHPDWSPDGTRIAYDWNLPSGVAEIAVTNLDGTEDHSLLTCDGPCYGNGGPAWSPDGGSIGFDGAEGPTEAHDGDHCYLALLDLTSGSVDRFLEHDGCEVAEAICGSLRTATGSSSSGRDRRAWPSSSPTSMARPSFR